MQPHDLADWHLLGALLAIAGAILVALSLIFANIAEHHRRARPPDPPPQSPRRRSRED